MKRNHRQNGTNKAQPELALQIAHIAAKILADEGINDYLLAKQRAVQRLHLPENSALPKNAVVHQCLASHLEIFDKNGLAKRQVKFRRLAIQIMEMLEAFQPLVVGSIVDGVITKTSRLQIHVFAPTAEDVAVVLIDQNIPYELTEQKICFSPKKTETKPAYNFLMGNTPANICVFAEKEWRITPIDPIYGKSTNRLNKISVENLL